jgi:FGGY-family pentulose kinase
MADAPYLMGIDCGTGGVRVGIFDRKGSPVGFSSVEFQTRHPHPGWAEQDPDDWWSALVEAVPAAIADGEVSGDEIAGISVDAMSSTVLAVDADGRPLRPAIMWMDIRASEQAERVAATGHPALKYNGHGAVSAEWGLPKALWIRDVEPKTYESARYILDCADWITQRLTGAATVSINTASSKYYFDRNADGWPARLYEMSGAGDLLEKFPEDVLDVGAPVGGLRRAVAEELGLRPDTPVAEASVDAYAGALGLGVVEPGTLALITGSSHVIIAQSAEPVHDPGFWGAYTDAMIPGQYTIEAGQASTGSIVAWFKNQLAGDAVHDAKRRGIDAYDLLAEMAEQVPVGSDGLLVLDYFQGNRSPHTDPRARGAVSGLSLSHGPGHLYRAIIEGICYGTEDILRTMREREFVPTLNVVSGGPARSELWMQIHADVSNVPISFTKVSEGPVLGAAIQASVGAGIYSDLATAAKSMVHRERTIEPDAARHEEYRFWVDRYRELYPAIRDVQHRVVRHVIAGDRRAAGAGTVADRSDHG